MKLTEIACIYHRADMDGKGSAAIVNYYHSKMKEQVDFIGMNYEPFDVEKFLASEYKLLYIVDYSIPAEQLLEILKADVRVVWCDHHKAAVEQILELGYDKAFNNFVHHCDTEGRCSAVQLTWEALFDTQVPTVVTLISVWDAWIKDHALREASEKFNIAASMFETWPDADFWNDMFSDSQKCIQTIDSMIQYGGLLLEYKNMQDKILMTSRSGVIQWQGFRFIVVNGSGNSKLIDQVFDPAIADAGMTFYYHPHEQKWKVSLYCADIGPKLDLSIIARKFGGGGHAGACGFAVDELPFDVKDIVSLKKTKADK